MDAAHIVATNLAREIITALDTWTPEDAAAAYGSSYSTIQDVQTLQFLRTCCLVNRQWCSLARPQLYRCLRVGEGAHLTRLQPDALERIAWSSELAGLVRYLDIHTYEIRLAAHLLANTPPFPHLKYICVSESSYPPKPLKYLPPYQSNSVTCLRYTSGSLHDLGLLMSMLPHLTTLHAGGWPYATHIDIPEEIKIVCKLRKVRFHLALRYKAKYLGWLLGSSVDSMEELSIKRAAHLLEEGIQYFEGVKRMSLFLPNCANKGTGDTDYYNLKSTLIRFTRLEQLHLTVKPDWKLPWPDACHAYLSELYPHLDIRYHRDTEVQTGVWQCPLICASPDGL